MLEAAAELGLDEDGTATEYFEGADGQEEVITRDSRAKRELGVGGVPHFFISVGEAQEQLGGAQPAEQLLEAFARVSRPS